MAEFTYQQYGMHVALIFQDGKAVCVAKHKDSLWTVWSNPMLGEPSKNVLYQFRPVLGASTLDELIETVTFNAHRYWSDT